MKNLLIQVTLDRANRKKDKSVSLSFITQLEQSSEEFMKIDSLLNDSGVLFFKSNGTLTKEEIKELENVEIEVEGKSKSQRLRNVMFILHKQLSEKNTINKNLSFNDFYSAKMEDIIEHYKSKLEPNI
jgi:hypothetical protein